MRVGKISDLAKENKVEPVISASLPRVPPKMPKGRPNPTMKTKGGVATTNRVPVVAKRPELLPGTLRIRMETIPRKTRRWPIIKTIRRRKMRMMG